MAPGDLPLTLAQSWETMGLNFNLDAPFCGALMLIERIALWGVGRARGHV